MVNEAAVYRNAGIHGVMIENMHDRRYVNRAVGPRPWAANRTLLEANAATAPAH